MARSSKQALRRIRTLLRKNSSIAAASNAGSKSKAVPAIASAYSWIARRLANVLWVGGRWKTCHEILAALPKQVGWAESEAG
jgi:hypothetical protein